MVYWTHTLGAFSREQKSVHPAHTLTRSARPRTQGLACVAARSDLHALVQTKLGVAAPVSVLAAV